MQCKWALLYIERWLTASMEMDVELAWAFCLCGVELRGLAGAQIVQHPGALRFDRETCRWSVLGTAASQEEANRSEQRQRILTVLAGKNEGLSVSEIMVAAELRNRNATDQLLFRMKEAGEVAHPKRGIYCLPEYASKIDKIRKIDDEATENKAGNGNLTNLMNRGISTPPIEKIGLGPEGALVLDEAPSGAPSDPRGTMVANGRAARVWIKTVRPAVSTEPDDGLFVM